MEKQIPTNVQRKAKITFVSGRIRVIPMAPVDVEKGILNALSRGVPFLEVPNLVHGKVTLQIPHIETIEEAHAGDINMDPHK